MAESILILNVSGIGDFVESTPALRRIRRLYPTAKITLAVSEKALPLAHRCPLVNEVAALPTSPGRSAPRLVDAPRWLQRLRPLRGRFDMAINLYGIASWQGEWWIRFLMAWSGAGSRIGDDRKGHAGVFNRTLASLLQRDRTDDMDRPELWIPEKTIEDTRDWIRGLPSNQIAVFLGGERRTRHEDPARAEVWLAEIQNRWQIHPIVIGSRSDPGLIPGTRIQHTDMRGKSGLEQTAAIIACSRALITTHSAPQHFAGVWNIPTVVIAGPGDIERYHPRLGSEQLRMLRNPVPCSPCYYEDCPLPGSQKKMCMTGISAGSIVQAFSEVFRATTTR